MSEHIPPVGHRCAECGEPVDRTAEGDWAHVRVEPGRYNHEADPVAESEIAANELTSICDFCDDKDLTVNHWLHIGDNYENVTLTDSEGRPLGPPMTGLGNWYACQKCHEDIIEGNQTRILNRGVRVQVLTQGTSYDVALRLISALHGLFWNTYSGLFYSGSEVINEPTSDQ